MQSEKELTPQQSLDVITTMIKQAKGNMQKNSFYFLLWGWTLVIANTGVYVLLKFTQVSNPYYMFFITLIAAVVSIIYGAKQGQQASVSTHLEDIYKWIWFGFGITCFTFWFFGSRIGWQLNPIIVTLTAIPTFISGILLKFKPLMYGGIVFWGFGILSFLSDLETQFLLGAIAVAVGYIIPGYLLKRSE